MSVVIKIIERADGVPDNAEDCFVKSFDVEAYDGRGDLRVTPDLDDAKTFADASEALTFYRQRPKCHLWRTDGKPNRPLTAYTILIEPKER
jgi:hypothetical protein